MVSEHRGEEMMRIESRIGNTDRMVSEHRGWEVLAQYKSHRYLEVLVVL